MDVKELKKLLTNIVNNREILRQKVRQNALIQEGFHEYTEELNAPVVEKLKENDDNLKRRFLRLDQNLRNALPAPSQLQGIESLPAPSSLLQGIEPLEIPKTKTPDKSPRVYDLNLNLDTKLLKRLNEDDKKNYPQEPTSFELPNYYINHPEFLQDAIKKSGELNQKYGGKKGHGIPEYVKLVDFVKIYRSRLLKVAELLKIAIEIPQVGTGLFLNANEMIERLYSLIGSRAAGNTSDEVRNEAVTLLNSLLKN